jgi:hypothetical protein
MYATMSNNALTRRHVMIGAAATVAAAALPVAAVATPPRNLWAGLTTYMIGPPGLQYLDVMQGLHADDGVRFLRGRMALRRAHIDDSTVAGFERMIADVETGEAVIAIWRPRVLADIPEFQ